MSDPVFIAAAIAIGIAALLGPGIYTHLRLRHRRRARTSGSIVTPLGKRRL